MRRRLSRRQRLRLTAGVMIVVALLAVMLGVWAYRVSRPETRRPGEELPEITDRLAQGLPPDAPSPAFTDVTAAAGLDGFRTFRGERTSQLPEDMGGGVAWGDYDGDGDDDLFLVAAGGPLDLPPAEWSPCRLYENLGDGAFRTVDSFPDLRILGMGAAWGDADADGDPDLVVSGYRALRLFRNEGEGRFVEDVSLSAPEGYWAGVSWADFDRDRDLDLYLAGYVRYEEPESEERRVSQQYGAAVPYTLNPASFEPERNLLFENRGDGSFEEMALYYGVSNPAGRSLGALWHDLDDDGRIDLYIANDISDNALFLNRDETFEDAGLNAWVADYRGAMGMAAGDWNRDGDDDLFITHWLAQENALYDSRLRSAPPSPESGLLRPAANGAEVQDLSGDGAEPRRLTFSDLSAPLGLGPIALPLVGWGTELVDLDGDGWLDLLVANGSTLEKKDTDKAEEDGAGDDAPRRLEPQKPLVLWNRHGEAFHDLAPLAPELFAPRVSRGLAVSDYDLDGDLDVLMVHLDGGVQLLRNDMQQGHWLELRLRNRLADGESGDPVLGDGLGATAVAWAGEIPLRRSVTGGSYLSQSTRTLHFGLGEATRVERLEVRWPTGEVVTFGPLAADSRWEIVEGEAEPRRLSEPASSDPERSDQEMSGVQEKPGPVASDRERVREFWSTQRAAMDAMKREGDIEKAVGLFERALELDPTHEDSRYYLANCLWTLGEKSRALEEMGELRRRSPRSHRAQRQWAVLKALSAEGVRDLEAAAAAARRALDINREETGALLVLGEIALLRGQPEEARRHLELACRSNPRAVGGFFLRGYLAWSDGDREESVRLLRKAQEARGPDWKPEGAVAEGDVVAQMHRIETPLSAYWQTWDGDEDPAEAFTDLADRLEG